MTEIALTDRESRRLKALEATIGKAAGDMYDAMRAIHDEKLYRAAFETWEDYCLSRWSMSATHASRLIDHGTVLCLLDSPNPKIPPIGGKIRISESATRELAGLPDDQKVEVLKQVIAETEPSKVGVKKVAAKAVAAKVREIRTREPGDESEPTGADPIKSNGRPIKATADLAESYVDDAGDEVPESLFPVWRERDTYMRICDDLKTMAGEIRELSKSPAGKGCSAIAREVDEAGKALALLMPSVVSGKSWKSIGDAK